MLLRSTTYCNVPEHFTVSNKTFFLLLHEALFSVGKKLKKVWAVIRNDKFNDF